MEERISELLGGEIARRIEELKNLEQGSEEHTRAVENLTKLYRLRIDETKSQWDYSEKFERAEKELELKKKQLDEQVKDRYFKVGVDAAGIVLPLIFYGIWMNRGFRFEETGTITSSVFRGLTQKFRTTR